MSSTATTRWQAFQYEHRHRPLKKVMHLAAFCMLLFLYGYLFFYVQEDRSFERMVHLNSINRNRIKAMVEEREAAKQKRREGKSNNEAEGEESADEAEIEEGDRLRRRRQSAEDPFSRFISTLFMFMVFNMVCRTVCCNPRFLSRIIMRHGSPRDRLRFQRLAAAAREQQFRLWADNLNRQRAMHGQPPISLDSLRTLLRQQQQNNNDGTDYDALLRFEEESGPALESLLQSGIGLSQEEINRLPLRELQPFDDLLRHESGNQNSLDNRNFCSICLEPYHVGNHVRTIPCFHTFHQSCIDQWLSNKAECPVCKHPAAA